MSSDENTFLFASLDSKSPSTTRKVHIRRLYDLLQLSIQRNDLQRARRAWSILARCKEVDWKSLWSTGLVILAGNASYKGDIEYLRMMMLQHPDERVSILQELVFRLLHLRRCREALEELELYLPSFPYQDNPVLHIYAGLSSLYLANYSSSSATTFNRSLMREAQAHLEHAQILDPDNTVAQAFLNKIHELQNERPPAEEDSEEEPMTLDDAEPHRKRSRT